MITAVMNSRCVRSMEAPPVLRCCDLLARGHCERNARRHTSAAGARVDEAHAPVVLVGVAVSDCGEKECSVPLTRQAGGSHPCEHVGAGIGGGTEKPVLHRILVANGRPVCYG